MKRAFLVLLVAATSCFAGFDESLDAHLGEWTIRMDTAGKQDGRVVTRVFAERSGASNEAQLELPDSALFILWTHLRKLPRQPKQLDFKRPKTDHVILNTDFGRCELLTDERAIALLRLWLDTHRAEWRATDSPELQTALRSTFFPPKPPKPK